MNFAAIGGAIWKGFKALPDWAWWIIVAVATGFFIDMRARGQQRQKDNLEREREARKVDNQILENSDDMVNQADRIRAANPLQPDGSGELREQPAPSWNYRD